MENFLVIAYIKSGKDMKQIQNILEAGLANLLKDHIRLVTEMDFHSSSHYKKWKKYAYDVRNDVIHRGKNVSELESKIAVETNNATIKFISSLTG